MSDDRARCSWPGSDPLYVRYHDEEWGVPVTEDRKLYEFLVLEGAQAGLGWITILRRREGYRRAFAAFDPEIVAGFGDEEIARLMDDPGIIRNGLKIRSAIQNARAFLKVSEEFGSFSDYIWRFVDGKPVVNHFRSLDEIPARTPLSDAISKDLKLRAFNFVGSTIVYAHMEATGMVNDHIVTCFRHAQVQAHQV